jgi:hypothetical protein
MIREPNNTERTNLAKAIAEEIGCDLEEANGYMAQYQCAIFESYMSDGPGYTGRVAVVVWGEPHIVSVYTQDALGCWRAEDVNDLQSILGR